MELPEHKQVWVALQRVHGVGPHVATCVLRALAVPLRLRTAQLTRLQRDAITRVLEDELVVEGGLRLKVRADINKLRRMGCYRGLRHRLGLPVRGQRTRTNAHTRKYAALAARGWRLQA
ncbi:putative 30S ribosomal subunit protein S13 [Candidatus Hodgkinia cicadicola Dsem]|nr:putative 30S ribosomal subunit protein S13 [Candidatus Hodgkinia cicadicola Dsem]